MKSKTTRIISMLLSILMLASMLSVFTFAANNYVPDDEYYDQIVHDAVIVNSAWAGYTNGQEIEYYFRNEIYGSTNAVKNAYSTAEELQSHYEKFDSTIHFSSLSDAIDFCDKNNIINPIIILCPGVYNEELTISKDVTILGTNAGINPNIVSEDNSPWAINNQMKNFTSLACAIEIDQFIENDIEVVFDGVKFINGFCYVDSGSKEVSSSVIVRNSVFDNISAPVIKQETLTSVFSFVKAASKAVSVTFEKVRAENLSVSLIGNYVYALTLSEFYYANSTAAITDDIDGLSAHAPNYVIKDSMFYNNVTEFGAIVIDHARKESSTRTKTELEIANTKFVEGPSNAADKNKATAPFITYVITGAKNKVNIHDCDFIAVTDHTTSPLRFTYSASAAGGIFSDSVHINSNNFIGFPVLNDTTGISKQSTLNFTGNYYATASGEQIDPIYPTAAAHNNIVLDYFWVDIDKTVSSNTYYITEFGAKEIDVRNDFKSIHITLGLDEKFDINAKTENANTKYTVYSDDTLKTEVKSLDASQLSTGFEKNVFYAVGVNPEAPDYEFIYTVYVSTYNPLYASEFNLYNTYMYSPEVKEMADGAEICKDWDGTSYKFIVGETIFATPQEIFEISEIPTILIPAGTYTENFCVTESAIILGAKHGVNPNIPEFENFETGWMMNQDRSNPDNETTFEGCAIYISTTAVNVTLQIDGITLGEGSAFFDTGEKLETYTTTTLKNIYINNAGGASFTEKDANGKDVARNSANILHFGGTGDDYSSNHKDVRLINIRYENQSSKYLLGTYMESLYIDGLYFAGAQKTLSSAELTSPKKQNFKLEVRNSFFYNCTPSSGGGIICVSNKQTDTPEREYNKVIYDHNLFYQPSTYLYGIIGIRFYSKRDSFYFTNNTVISTYAQHSLMPGNTGWFTGLTACENLSPDQYDTAETVSDVIYKFNRICGPYKPVDKQNVKPDTCWDYSYNYVCDLDYATTVGGNFEGGIFDRSTPGIKMSQYSDSQKNYMKCTTYFKDWYMTELVDAPDSYKTELDYSIDSPGKITKVDSTNFNYTDSVIAGVDKYTFNIKLKTPQASYGVYEDIDCTKQLSDTVALNDKTNVFYIKFASYKSSIVHLYKATITKQLSSEAKIIAVDNHPITGNNITAIVPIGTTSLLLKNIKLSSGATYKIYNDAAKTKPFLVTKITNISETPIVKYIEVTSEDKTTVKDYVLTVKQGLNSIADITNIENAVKIDDSTYEAYIPVESNTFELNLTATTGSSTTVKTEGREQHISNNIPLTIHNVGDYKEIKINVTSETGNTKTVTLIIIKDQSNVELSYIFNMYNPSNDESEFYTKVNTETFTLQPVFKNIATTYEIYKDKACTKLYELDNELYLTKASNVFYMKASSIDGTTTKVYTLTVDTNNPTKNAPITPDEPSNPDNPTNPENPGQGVVITNIFKDVEAGSWYEKYVKYAYENKLFGGTSATTFDPNGSMTRAQFVRVIANFVGAEVDNNITSSFTDVKSGQWYTGAIEWAYKAGVVSGVGNNKFNPDAKITREEMCVMIANASEKLLNTRLPEIANPINFTDDAKISSWARAAVYKCQRAGLVSGMGNNTFAPSNTTTRAEGATLFTNCHMLLATLSK